MITAMVRTPFFLCVEVVCSLAPIEVFFGAALLLAGDSSERDRLLLDAAAERLPAFLDSLIAKDQNMSLVQCSMEIHGTF